LINAGPHPVDQPDISGLVPHPTPLRYSQNESSTVRMQTQSSTTMYLGSPDRQPLRGVWAPRQQSEPPLRPLTPHVSRTTVRPAGMVASPNVTHIQQTPAFPQHQTMQESNVLRQTSTLSQQVTPQYQPVPQSPGTKYYSVPQSPGTQSVPQSPGTKYYSVPQSPGTQSVPQSPGTQYQPVPQSPSTQSVPQSPGTKYYSVPQSPGTTVTRYSISVSTAVTRDQVLLSTPVTWC